MFGNILGFYSVVPETPPAPPLPSPYLCDIKVSPDLAKCTMGEKVYPPTPVKHHWPKSMKFLGVLWE